MAELAEEKAWVVIARAAAKDVAVGLAIGVGLYVLWVVAHSILFGMG